MKMSPERIFGGLLATWIMVSFASLALKVEFLGKVSMVLGWMVMILSVGFGAMAVFLLIKERYHE